MTSLDTVRGFPAPPAWTEDALCAEVDSDVFFPSRGDSGGRLATARAVCALCPVRDDCLEYALAYESGVMGVDTAYVANGVWGGLSPNERKQILRERETQQEAS